MLKYILTLLFCSYAWLGSADLWLPPCNDVEGRSWLIVPCVTGDDGNYDSDCIYYVYIADPMDGVDCVTPEAPLGDGQRYRHIPLDTPYFVIIGLFITYVLIIYYRRSKV